MKLKNRIHLYSTVLFIVLIIMMNTAIYFTFSSLTINNEQQRTEAEMLNIARNVHESAGAVPIDDLLRAYVPVNGMIRIVTEEGSTSSVTSSTEQQLRELETTYYREQWNTVVELADKSYAFVSLPVIWMDGSIVNLQVVESLEAIENNLQVLQIVLVIVTIIAILPVVVSSRVLSNLILKPITSMIETMREIQKSGNYKRIEVDRSAKDELSEMGTTFNNMIELLEANYKKQKNFVSSASHELKTPLTIIDSYASLLKRRGKERPDLMEEAVNAIYSETTRMKGMTEQLLMLAKNQEQWNVTMENVKVHELVQEVAGNFQKAYQRDINVVTEQERVIFTDVNKLKQLLFIFIDNARKYSKDSIKLTVQADKTGAIIKVEDKGIGIPKSEMDKVFDWFYRVDQARNRKIGGTGLGLSLAKEIADALSIRIVLESSENVGTTITLYVKDKQFDGSSHHSH